MMQFILGDLRRVLTDEGIAAEIHLWRSLDGHHARIIAPIAVGQPFAGHGLQVILGFKIFQVQGEVENGFVGWAAHVDVITVGRSDCFVAVAVVVVAGAQERTADQASSIHAAIGQKSAAASARRRARGWIFARLGRGRDRGALDVGLF